MQKRPALSDGVSKAWTWLVACVAVAIAVASLICGPVTTVQGREVSVAPSAISVAADQASDTLSDTPFAASEASNDLPPDDQAWLSIAAAADPLDCSLPEPIPTLEDVIASKWSPDSTTLAVARVIVIPSRLTITGYEEDPVLSLLDLRTGEVRELGQGDRPEWSGTGTFLSFWKSDGYVHILQGDANVGTIEVSQPDVRWVGDVLYYWYAGEVRSWDRGVTQAVSHVASNVVPRYPHDHAFFSADGERFTITRYATNGTTARYIGVTATGETSLLDEPDVTYTEWSPRGQTLLMRSQDRVALRHGDGSVQSAPLASLPGPVHGWSPDGELLLGVLSPTALAGNTFDRFQVWDGKDAFATLPNLFGARLFSPDGRYFTGVSRTGLEATRLEVYRCGVTGYVARMARADMTARSRSQSINDGHRFVRPAAGMIVQFVQGSHTGVDVAAPFGSLLFAADDGVVNAVGWVPVGGRRVCVMRSDGLESCHYHTSLSLVAVGDTVVRGQAVALVGMTGLTSGPHVHWEVKRNGMVVNPLDQ